MSETLRALEGAQRIAGNLGNVIGGNMIRSAESNRADQALKYSLGRQKIQDAQQAELFRRNTEAYEREKADRMRPFNIADIMGSPFALNHLSAKNKNGEMNADGIARILGGKLDKDEKSPTNGQVITPNGVVTREEVKRKWPRLRAYMFQNTNMEKAAEDQIAEAALKMKSAKTPEEIQAYQAEIAKNESFLNDPKQRVAQLQHKIDVLGQLKAVIKDEGIEKDITGLEKKRDKYLDMIEKEKDRALKRELADKRIRAERAKGKSSGTPNRDIEMVEYFNEVYGGSRREALDLFRKDKQAAEALRGAREEISARKDELEYAEPKARKAALKEIFDRWGVGDFKSQLNYSKRGRNARNKKRAQSYTQSVIDKIKLGTNQD